MANRLGLAVGLVSRAVEMLDVGEDAVDILADEVAVGSWPNGIAWEVVVVRTVLL